MANRPTEPGHNITQLKADIVEAVQKIRKEKDKRSAANEEISAIRERLQAAGIHKKALAMAMTYVDLDPDKREGFDTAYDIVRDALGAPYNAQGDLFKHTTEGKSKEMVAALGGEDEPSKPMTDEDNAEAAAEMDAAEAEVEGEDETGDGGEDEPAKPGLKAVK